MVLPRSDRCNNPAGRFCRRDRFRGVGDGETLKWHELDLIEICAIALAGRPAAHYDVRARRRRRTAREACKSHRCVARASGDSHGLSRRPSQAHQAFGHHGGDRQGARAQSGRPRRHRAWRRRAGFRYARQHQAGGDQGDHGRQDREIHRGRGHARAQGRNRAQVQAREHARLQAEPDHRRHRRQAGALQRAGGDAQSRRRGHHPGALLGQLSGHGGARWRRSR